MLDVPVRELTRSAAYRAVANAWTEPVVIACSGGTDSSALVVLASIAMQRSRIGPCTVVHVDHRSRVDSLDDGRFVENLCSGLDLPFIQARVSEAGSAEGRSLEDVWRERRYDALGEVAASLGVKTIVTAHNRGDQLETVLMRLLGGSARLGMRSGVEFTLATGRFTILRPLLDIDRSELRLVLDLASVTPIDDPSNEDRSFRRNAVRHELMPAMEHIFPGFSDALLRSMHLRETDAEYCDMQAAKVYAELVQSSQGSLSIDRAGLRALHPAIASRVVLLAARTIIQGTDNREMSHERVGALLGALEGRSGAVIELPYGVRVLVKRDQLVFSLDGEGTGHD